MKKENLIAIIPVLLFLIFCLAGIIAMLIVGKPADNNVYTLSFKTAELYFSEDEVNKLKEAGYDVSYVKKVLVTVETFREKSELEVIETDDNFQYISNKKIKNGSWFNEIQVQKKEKVTVINKNAALKFFGTLNATGNQIKMNDEVYEISGVVEDKKEEMTMYIPPGCMENQTGYSQIWCKLNDKIEVNLLLKIINHTLDEMEIKRKP